MATNTATLTRAESTTSQFASRPGADRLPLKGGVSLAFTATLLVAVLMATVSVIALVFGSAALYGLDPTAATGVTSATAGLLIPGFLGQDVFNLVVALPLLLGSLWAAHRGSRVGLLLWPGVLFYAIYTYTHYLIAAPLNAMFLAYVSIVSLSAFTAIGLVASIDREQVREGFGGAVPARVVGGILIGLALMTLAQDGGGSVGAIVSGTHVDPGARGIWVADLTLEVPVMLLGGVLLWGRCALGYLAAPGLLLQFGLTPFGLAAIMAGHGVLTGTPMSVGTIAGVLIFCLIAFAPLAYFVRGAISHRRSASTSPGHIGAM
jgi:hypothetical protein